MKKIHLLLTLVALFLLATTNLSATPPAVGGKLICGKFSVSVTQKIYFSQGNLQYQASTNTWRFGLEQYHSISYSNSSISSTYSGWIDLFGWGTKTNPWNTSKNNADYSWNEWGENAISNGGNTANSGWRTLTTQEWGYLLNASNSSDPAVGRQGNRYAKATVHSVKGLIILPDGWTQAGSGMSGTLSGINTPNAEYTIVSDANWTALENKGAVFLPAAGERLETTVYDPGMWGEYWSSSAGDAGKAYVSRFSSAVVQPQYETPRYVGLSVRLVQDATGEAPIASVTDAPTPNSLTYIQNTAQALVTTGTAAGGTMMYRLGTSGGYSASIPTATNAGEYIVQYMVEGSVCVNDFTPDDNTINVTIAKAPYTPTGSYSVTGNNLSYTGSAQDLVTATNSSNGTLQYSIDGGNTWSATIPQGTNAVAYTVLYKVVPSNSNYEDYIPDPAYIIVNIAKLPYTPSGTYSVTVNDLTYNGSPQALVSLEGSVTDGTVWYKLEPSGEWTTEIPTGNNAGNYSVSYKVVPTDPNYDEYIPNDSPIAVTIAKANPSATLPESTISIPYDGAEHTLLEIDPVADCVIWYKLGDGDWTTTPPTGTDAGDYSVQYKIVPNDAVNYNTIGPNTVTVTILDYPTVYDNADPLATLTTLLNTPSDLKVKRTIYADDEYNTICLPFALDESALAASPLAGFNRLKTFKGAQVTGTAPNLYIDIFVEDATTIEAGIPYLITYPSAHADIVDPVFNGITVTTTEPSAVSVDGITFQGMFAQVHIDPYDAGHTQDYLFLGANSQLYWPLSTQTSSDIKMRGFRAYFIIDRNSITPALAPKGTRARIMDAPKTTTGIDETSATTCTKLIENGQLIILKNGIKYNAQGQVVK